MKANSKQDQLISAGKGKVKTLNGSDKFIFVSYIGQCSGTWFLKSCPVYPALWYIVYSLIGKDTDTAF